MKAWPRLVALGVVASTMVLALIFDLVLGETTDGFLFAVVGSVLFGLAALLVWRVPGNRVSWVVLAIAWGVGLLGLGDFAAGVALFAIVLPGIGVLLPLWFPTGQLPTAGWRWVEYLVGIGVLVMFIGTLIVGVQAGDLGADVDCVSPAGCVSVGGLAMVLIGILASVVSLVVRWVRSQGSERQALKLFTFSVVVFGIGAYAEFGGFQDSLIASVFLPVGLLLIPASIVIGVLRYRLYEIDRIISRTIGYALVVTVLGVVYVVGAVWLPTRVVGDEVPAVFVAGSTLLVIVLFNPVRRRLLGWVDRRFYRSRYDAVRVAEEFSSRLKDEVDVDRLAGDWVGVVTETMQPATVGIWVRE